MIRTPVLPQARKRLSIRQKVKLHDEHGAICIVCGNQIERGERFIDEHRLPLGLGGSNAMSNRGPAHVKCALVKTKRDRKLIDRSYRVRARDLGIIVRKGRPLPGGRYDRLKQKIGGEVVDRETGGDPFPKLQEPTS